MNIIKYNKYNFLIDHVPSDMIKESSEFGDMQMGMGSPLGSGFGFAHDPSLNLYSDGSTPYVDNYQRMSTIVQDLERVMKDLYSQNALTITAHKMDYFLDDIDEYKNMKILRIYINAKLTIDVFISFDFMDEEFFGVYHEYNGLNKPKLETDLFSDPRFRYIDGDYKLKLSNYFYKILYNWFIPAIGEYIVLADEIKTKNVLGDNIYFKKGQKFKIKGYNIDNNNKPFLMLVNKEDNYKIVDNDFFYFNYWCKKID